MLIDETPFVVVDTETTGVRADSDHVIELAAVRVQAGRVAGRFSQLINPGRAIPRRITQLTGITTALVYDEPKARDVLPRFLEFLGDDVLVAHNLPFDLRFLNTELRRIQRPEISNPTLCTLRLARRILRGLHSKALPSVAAFYKIAIEGRHRAYGDAEATACVLVHMLEAVRRDHGVQSVEDLLKFQHRSYRSLSAQPKRLRRLREEVLTDLPDRPGVYFMRDRRGAILYIGKATSLRDRVRSYFNAVEAHAPRIRKLVGAVHDVTWEETGSELAALLLESRLIKQHQPRFNRALRRYRNRPFIRLDTQHPFPRVTVTPYVLNDGAEYFGPLGGRRQAELTVSVIDRFFKLRECDDDTFRRGTRCFYADIGRCGAPCAGKTASEVYEREITRVRAFINGSDRSVLQLIGDEMRAAAERLAFEEAGQYRDWMQRLERMLDRQQRVAAPVLSHNAVLCLPGATEGTVQLFLVRFGRHEETVVLSQPPERDEMVHLRQRLERVFDAGRSGPERYMKEEADEIRILAHWMYVHRDEAVQQSWTPDLAPQTFAGKVLAMAATAAADGVAA